MINLEKILSRYPTFNNEAGYGKAYVLAAMKEACEKAIDICLNQIVDEEDKEMQQCVEAIRENILSIKKEIK